MMANFNRFPFTYLKDITINYYLSYNLKNLSDEALLAAHYSDYMPLTVYTLS